MRRARFARVASPDRAGEIKTEDSYPFLIHKEEKMSDTDSKVVDLFSCGGGMSAGFKGKGWVLAGAVDLEVAKPSGRGSGETGCNQVYAANHDIMPLSADLNHLDPRKLMEHFSLSSGEVGCLISCAPCTDFSRANPANHLTDKSRNTLV